MHAIKGLQALYEKYKDKGFVILGFPCNQVLTLSAFKNEVFIAHVEFELILHSSGAKSPVTMQL